MDIIQLLLNQIQELNKIIKYLLVFICKFIPLKQWIHDDSHSPKYQKFKVDKLPVIQYFEKLDYIFLIKYYMHRYGVDTKPIRHKSTCSIPENTVCPRCGAPSQYIYDNNGNRGQYKCKICSQTFHDHCHQKFKNLLCPHCNHVLQPIKSRKHFIIHKCINKKCPYYLHNLKKVDKKDLESNKNKYKLHYIYRQFVVDFFEMDINSIPKNASSLKFKKHDAYTMGLCLTLHINLQLSLRKTAQSLNDLFGIKISHQQVANYCKTAALCVKPLVDNFTYNVGSTFVGDETYIKVKGIKHYVWFIIDALSRSLVGYTVSDNRGVGPCILAMRMAFRNFINKLPDQFKFIADGYSAYPLAAQQFAQRYGDDFNFEVTQVIGLSNDDAVSKKHRPYKQMIERLNRTYKVSYRPTNGFENIDGAAYDLALWVAYYNFLRPHKFNSYKTLNNIDALNGADNMPSKWQLLIYLGQKTIMNQQSQCACS